jgi:hypothetical protein
MNDEAILELVPTPHPSDAGKPKLVFIHGAWHAAWCWLEFFVTHFRELGFAAHALNLIGHGGRRGRKALRWVSLRQYVGDAIRILKDWNEYFDGMPILCGHSLGGRIVQEIIKRERVPLAVLLGTAPVRGIAACSWRLFRAQPADFLCAMAVGWDFFRLVDSPARAHRNLFSAATPRDWVTAHSTELQTESYRVFLDMWVPVGFRRPRKPPPMLVLHGENDAVFTERESRRTAEHYGARFEMLKGLAHDLMLEPRWELAARSIADWLKDQCVNPPECP